MSTIISAVSIDTADAAALAAFWAEALGRPVNPGGTANYAAIDAADPADGPKLTFHKVPDSTTVNNRLRLALRTDRFEAESQRLVELGAKPLGDYEKPALRWTTFADPDGNHFDLVTVLPAA
ncbi:VOC family protein [Actinospica sp.]|jgi:predicted enzyme related to lactoylglutathione lyase|uniref:VOC family protein n=1 Tax=Actinospica sp. TaxID=1872142 RepID=UPI002C732A6B|nr:VOC family protein [Actinospica sp.]HWG26001.1 VOC family protein [Actinospica sp.]